MIPRKIKTMTCAAIRILFAFTALIMLNSRLVAQEEVLDLSLGGALAGGLESNYQILISAGNVSIAENNASWGAAGLFPSISIGAFQSNRYDEADNRNIPGQRDRYYTNFITPSLALNWKLFSGFSVHMAKDKLDALYEYTEGYATIVVENTLQGIVLAYYNALLQEELLAVTEEVMALSRDRYRYMTYRQELGSSLTYDVLQTQNAYLEDSATNLLQQLNVKNAYLNLKLLLGEKRDIQYRLTDEFSVELYELSLDSLLFAMKAGNNTLRNQYVNQEILKKDVQLAKSAMYPVLSMSGGIDHTNSRIRFTGDDPAYFSNFDYYVGFSLNFNLFNGGNVRRNIKNARIGEQIGQLETEEIEITLTNLMKNYHKLYQIRKQLYLVSVANLETAKLNLEISADKFRAGAINSFNYRDVQVYYLRAAVEKIRSIYNLIDIQTEILRLSGGIISEY
jgi:outer membrane protein TolC